jgi:hypothetical protein
MTSNRLFTKEVRLAGDNSVRMKKLTDGFDHSNSENYTINNVNSISKLKEVSGGTETRDSTAANISEERIADVQRSNENDWNLVERSRKGRSNKVHNAKGNG